MEAVSERALQCLRRLAQGSALFDTGCAGLELAELRRQGFIEWVAGQWLPPGSRPPGGYRITPHGRRYLEGMAGGA